MALDRLDNRLNAQVRVRFAPSPTGHLHIGGARAALFNWLFARHNKGIFLVRIEDTDRERSKPEYTKSIIKSLSWLSMTSDKPLVMQSDNAQRHKEIVEHLLQEGKAYKCYCPAKEHAIKEQVEKMEEDEISDLPDYSQYDKTCRFLSLDNNNHNKPYVIRFKIPDNKESIEFNDLIRGHITFDRDQLDDFIIMRSDGSFTYNFVVVVDDADMAITHVIRGEDHISNTPKQILLYQACGFKEPYFAHLPLILGASGQRLSKRDAATSVLDYKYNGFLPEALNNYLVRLGWSHGDQEIFTYDELIEYFSLKNIGKKASIFDIKKLEWVNNTYIKEQTCEYLYNYIEENLNICLHKEFKYWGKDTLLEAIDLYKDRVATLKELLEEINSLYKAPIFFSKEDKEQWNKDTIQCYMGVLENAFYQQEDFTVDAIKNMVKNICTNLKIKLPELAKPLRLALTGKNSSPGIFDIVLLLGKKEAIKRLRYFRESIKA